MAAAMVEHRVRRAHDANMEVHLDSRGDRRPSRARHARPLAAPAARCVIGNRSNDRGVPPDQLCDQLGLHLDWWLGGEDLRPHQGSKTAR